MARQVWYPHTELEEHRHGMWRRTSVDERDGFIAAAAALMRDVEAFLDAMLLAVREWPNSMEAAMTTPSLNRRAFIGHAGCCVATGSPEDLTRLGWHELSELEQAAANDAADQAILEWERSFQALMLFPADA